VILKPVPKLPEVVHVSLPPPHIQPKPAQLPAKPPLQAKPFATGAKPQPLNQGQALPAPIDPHLGSIVVTPPGFADAPKPGAAPAPKKVEEGLPAIRVMPKSVEEMNK
jgi:hypothetical protein